MRTWERLLLKVMQMKWKWLLILSLGLLLLLGCTKKGTTPQTTPGATPAPVADTSLKTVKDRGKLQVGMSGTYPPFAFRDAAGNLIGFDVEITQEVAKRLGVTPEYVTMPFKGLVAALDTKRFDLIANQMGITPERQARYAFSKPYVNSGSQLLVHKDNTTINSMADVKGKKFGASQGSNYEKMLRDAGAEVVLYTTDSTMFADIAAKRIEGTLNDRLQVAYLIKQGTQPLRAAGPPTKGVDVALMFRKEDSALVAEVNKALDGMLSDGTYKRISAKWFGEDVRP
jgi:cystine transport system substrate-binding protein